MAESPNYGYFRSDILPCRSVSSKPPLAARLGMCYASLGMAYLVGTDEAGYGPNWPLVISATVWETPDGIGGEELFGHACTSLRRSPACNGRTAPAGRASLWPTRRSLRPGKGLRHLERGLWAALGFWTTARKPGATCGRPWPRSARCDGEVPWYVDYDGPAPLACEADEIEPLAARLRGGLAAAGVRLVAMRSRVIFAHQFNDLVDRYGSKGIVLSLQTLGLAAEMIEPLPAGPISLVCDKHGGRTAMGAAGQAFSRIADRGSRRGAPAERI